MNLQRKNRNSKKNLPKALRYTNYSSMPTNSPLSRCGRSLMSGRGIARTNDCYKIVYCFGLCLHRWLARLGQLASWLFHWVHAQDNWHKYVFCFGRFLRSSSSLSSSLSLSLSLSPSLSKLALFPNTFFLQSKKFDNHSITSSLETITNKQGNSHQDICHNHAMQQLLIVPTFLSSTANGCHHENFLIWRQSILGHFFPSSASLTHMFNKKNGIIYSGQPLSCFLCLDNTRISSTNALKLSFVIMHFYART